MRAVVTALLAVLLLFACCASCSWTYNAPPAGPSSSERSLIDEFNVARYASVHISVSVDVEHAALPEEGRKKYFVGSGSVIGHGTDSSLVLTAAHVCQREYAPVELPGLPEPVDALILSKRVKVSSAWESGIVAEVLIMGDDDICVLKTKKRLRTQAVMLGQMPQVGEEIYYAGGPANIWWKGGNVPVIYGRVNGFVNFEGFVHMMLTAPTFPGASGSPVFHRGRLVGVVVSYNRDFPSVGFAVMTPAVEEIVRKALKSK
jgi:hypothetical protein